MNWPKWRQTANGRKSCRRSTPLPATRAATTALGPATTAISALGARVHAGRLSAVLDATPSPAPRSSVPAHARAGALVHASWLTPSGGLQQVPRYSSHSYSVMNESVIGRFVVALM
jgi:hypothetical protein